MEDILSHLDLYRKACHTAKDKGRKFAYTAPSFIALDAVYTRWGPKKVTIGFSLTQVRMDPSLFGNGIVFFWVHHLAPFPRTFSV